MSEERQSPEPAQQPAEPNTGAETRREPDVSKYADIIRKGTEFQARPVNARPPEEPAVPPEDKK